MTNREICINIVNGMVERGYNLMGRTVEQLVDMMGADVKFFETAAHAFDEWQAGQA